MRALAKAAVCLLAACATVPPQSAPERWFEVTSEHFAVRTDVGADEGAQLAAELEKVRAGLLAAAWRNAAAPPGRLAVIVLRNRAELALLAPESFGGFVASDLLGGRLMVLQAEGGLAGQATLAHELAHVLAHAFLLRQPRWLAEGLAGFLQTIRIDEARKLATLGVPPQGPLHHLARRGVLSSAQLFAWQKMSFGAENADLYATSWLLVHYLLFEKTAQFGDYQRRLMRAEDPADAFARAFPGLTTDLLDEGLREHLQTRLESKTFPTFSLPLAPAAAPSQSAPLGAAEVHALWATLLLISPGPEAAPEREQRALPELREALRLDPTNVTALWAQSTTQRPPPDQLERERAAAEAHADDWRALTLLARTVGKMPEGQPERDELIARAAALAPGNPSVLQALARSHLRHKRPAEALAVAQKADLLHPGDPFILDLIAGALLGVDRCKEALQAEQRAIEVLPHDAPEQALHDLGARLEFIRRRCG